MPKQRGLTTQQIAGRLALSYRQIHNLCEKGMPRTGAGSTFLWPECLRWYIEFKALTLKPPQPDKEKRARLFLEKLDAETRVAKVAAAEAEGRVIPLELHEQRFASVCDRLRAVLTNLPARYGAKIQQARTAGEARIVGNAIRDETFRSLLDVAGELETEVIDDAGDAA